MSVNDIINRHKKHLTNAQVHSLVKLSNEYKQLNAGRRAEAYGDLYTNHQDFRRGLQNMGLASRRGNIISGREVMGQVRVDDAYHRFNDQLNNIEDRMLDNAAGNMRAQNIARQQAQQRNFVANLADQIKQQYAAKKEFNENAVDPRIGNMPKPTKVQPQKTVPQVQGDIDPRFAQPVSAPDKAKMAQIIPQARTAQRTANVQDAVAQARYNANKAANPAAYAALEVKYATKQKALADNTARWDREISDGDKIAKDDPEYKLYKNRAEKARREKANAQSSLYRTQLAVNLPADVGTLVAADDADFAVRYSAAEKLYKDAVENAKKAKGKSASDDQNAYAVMRWQNAEDELKKATDSFAKFEQAKAYRNATTPMDFYVRDMKVDESLVPKTEKWVKPGEWNGSNFKAAFAHGWEADDYAKKNDTKGSKYAALVNDWSLVNGRTALLYSQDFQVTKGFLNVADFFTEVIGKGGTTRDADHNRFLGECVQAYKGDYESSGTKSEKEQMDAMLTLANLMTDEERATFNTILNRSGASAADEYFKHLYNDVLPMRFDEYVHNEQKFDTRDTIGKVRQSLFSVPVNLTQGVTGVAHTMTTQQDDPVAAMIGARKYNTAQSMRDVVSEDMSEFGKFAYGTGMSMADSMTVAAISGGIGSIAEGLGASAALAGKIGSTLGGSLLGGSAFNSAYSEALDRGLSPDKARATALGQGINEMLFEAVSLDLVVSQFQHGGVLKVAKNRWVNWAVNAGVSAGVEGSEELTTDVANELWDKYINGIYSEELTKLREYIGNGMSYENAKAQVQKEFDAQLGMSFLGGAVSGGIMGGGASIIGTIYNRDNAKFGHELRKNTRVMDELKGFDYKSETAQDILTQSKLTDEDVSDLFNIRQQELLEQNIDNIKEAVKNGTITQEDADLLNRYKENGVQVVKDGKVTENENGITAEEYSRVQEILPQLQNGAEIQFLNNEEMREMVNAVGGEVAAAVDTQQTQVQQADRTYQEAVNMINADTTLTDEQKNARIAEAETERAQAVSTANKQFDTTFKSGRIEVSNGSVKVSKGSGSVTFDYGSRNTLDSMTANEASALRIAKVVASRGVNVKMESEFTGVMKDGTKRNTLNGYYDKETNTIHVNLSGNNSVLWTVSHELTHYLAAQNTQAYEDLRSAIESKLKEQNLTASELNLSYDMDRVVKYINKTENLYDALVEYEKARGYDSDAEEEVIARCCESFLANRIFVQSFAKKNYKSAKAISEFLTQMNTDMRRVFDDAMLRATEKGIYNDMSPEQEILSQVADIDDIARLWSNAVNNVRKQRGEESVSGKIAKEEGRGGVAFSIKQELRDDGQSLSDRSMKYRNAHASESRHISDKTLDTANKQIRRFAERMLPYLTLKNKKGMTYLPDEVLGKTRFGNSSYGGTSIENTTICFRTLSYIDFTNEIKKRIGRPLTVSESFLASQMLYQIAKEPQCLYCYVSLDRKAYDEQLLSYIKQRDKVVEGFNKLSLDERQAITKATRNPSKAFEGDVPLYTEFLAGRKNTEQMRTRFAQWIDIANSGSEAITAADLATDERRGLMRNGDDWQETKRTAGKVSLQDQVIDAERYAQSASWAKKMEEYRAYNGDILKIGKRTVNKLNNEYGLRFYSFSEYSPAFIVENMQQIRDAALKGLMGLAYTKKTDFARIFAGTGMNINVSTFGRWGVDADGNRVVVMDSDQGADWTEVQNLRKQYENVGAVFVATDDAMTEWAIKQDWIDVVIPFHIVRTGANVAEFYKWVVHNSEQNDVTAEGKNATIPAAEHGNSYEKYMSLVNERGLTPRFDKWRPENNPNVTADEYMKLVNETRRTLDETNPLQPIYDTREAARSFAAFVHDGGYYGDYYKAKSEQDIKVPVTPEQDILGIGSKTYTAQEGVDRVVADIKAGNKANQVPYGRQDIDQQISRLNKARRIKQHGQRLSTMDDVKLSDKAYTDLAQKYKDGTATDADKSELRKAVDAAAKAAGYKYRLYRGGGSVHNVFDTKRGKGTTQYGQGTYFTDAKGLAEEWALDRAHDGEDGYVGEYYVRIGTLFDDENIDTSTRQWKKVESILKQYGATDRQINIAKEWGFSGIQRVLDSLGKAESKTIFGKGVDETNSILQNAGYDGIKGEFYDAMQYVIFDPTQAKSADLVTYDKDGNIIPLSERFNENEDDIRFSTMDNIKLNRKGNTRTFELKDTKATLIGNDVELEGGTIRQRVAMMKLLAEHNDKVRVDAASTEEAEAFRRAGAVQDEMEGRGKYGTWEFKYQRQPGQDIYDPKQKVKFAKDIVKQIGSGRGFTAQQKIKYNEALGRLMDKLYRMQYGNLSGQVVYDYAERVFDNMLDDYTAMDKADEEFRSDILANLSKTKDGKGRTYYVLEVNEKQMQEIKYAYENAKTYANKLSTAIGARVTVKQVENASMLEDMFNNSTDTRFNADTNEGDMPNELLKLARETEARKTHPYKGMSEERMATKEAMFEAAMNAAGVEKTAAQKVREAVKEARAEERAKAKAEKKAAVEKATLAAKINQGALREKIRREEQMKYAEATKRFKEKLTDKNAQVKKDIITIAKSNYNRLVSMLANPTEASHVPVQLAKEASEFAIALSDLLDADMGKKADSLNDTVKSKRGVINFDKLIKAYENSFADAETIQQAQEENPDYNVRGQILDNSLHDDQLVQMMKALNKIMNGKTIKQMDAYELRLMLNTIRGVLHTIYDANKMVGTSERKAYWKVADTFVNQLESAPKVKGRMYFNEALDMRRLALIYSGSNENAEFVKLVKMLNDGAIEKERVAQVLKGMFDPLTEQYGDEIRTWYGKKAEWIDTGIVKNGRKVEITKGMRVSLALHVLNEGNMRHIENGGLTIPDKELYAKGKLSDAYSNKAGRMVVQLNADEINAIIAQMTDAEKAYVEVAKEFFHKRTGYYVNKTSLQLLGYRKAVVDNYFPIHSNDNYTQTDFASVVRDGSIEGQGFLKERVVSGNPIYLEDITSVVNRQIKGVSLYAGLAVPMRNFKSVMNAQVWHEQDGVWKRRTSVKETMTDVMGDYGTKIVQGFLQDVSGMSAVDVSPAERVVAQLQTRYVKAVLLANLKVTLKQAASYPTAAAVIPWKYLNKALLKGGKNGRLISRADVDLINQYTPLYQMRREGMANEITTIMAEKGLEQKMPWLLGWITKMDVATVGRLWSAAEYMVADTQKNLPVGSDAYYKAVAEIFNKTIQQTQPNFTPLQRNAALRSKNPVVRTLTLFGTQRMQNGGLLIEAFAELKNSKDKGIEAQKAARKKVGRVVASQLIQNAMLCGIGLLVDALRGRMKSWQDDDKDVTVESISKYMGDQFLGNMFGSFLGGSEAWDAASTLYKRATGGDAYDTEFTVPALDALESIIGFMNKDSVEFVKYMTGDHTSDEKLSRFKSWSFKLAKAGGYATGLPIENIAKTFVKGWIPALQDIADATKTGELNLWLHQSGKLDKAKTAANYKEWITMGYKGSEYFYWENKLSEYGKRDEKIPVLLDSDLPNEKKAMLLRMTDKSGATSEGTVVYKANGDVLIDFAAPTEKQKALPMPGVEVVEPDAKQMGVDQVVANGVERTIADEAFDTYQSMKKNHDESDEYSTNDEFREWLFKNVDSPEQRAALEYQVVGQAASVKGSVTYRENGAVYRDYTNEAWYKLSSHNLSKDGTNKRYDAGKKLEKMGIPVEKTAAIYEGLAKYTKKAEWIEYLKRQGLTDEQITIFLWSRGWAK